MGINSVTRMSDNNKWTLGIIYYEMIKFNFSFCNIIVIFCPTFL